MAKRKMIRAEWSVGGVVMLLEYGVIRAGTVAPAHEAVTESATVGLASAALVPR